MNTSDSNSNQSNGLPPASAKNDAHWTRSSSGVVAGVCKGLAQRFDIDVMIVRLALVFSVLFFGFGLYAYIILAVSFPREDKLASAYEKRISGVCVRFAKRFDIDVGLTRAGFLTMFFLSMGGVILAYILLYFVLPKAEEFKTT